MATNGSSKLGTVAFVGVGAMGSRMIRHLAKEADLLVYDTNAGQAAEVAREVGGRAVTQMTDIASAGTVILMLPSSAVVDKVVRGDGGKGLFGILASGSLVIDMSSSQPTSTVENARLAKEQGITYLDAPVSGGIGGAESGKLAIMVGGTPAEVERARPILERMGSRVVRTGDVGAGHAVKALNNLLAATTLAATSEVFAVGRKFGLDPAVMHEVINASSGTSFQTSVVWPRAVLQKKWDFGFTAQLMEKDVRVAMSLIDALDVNPVLSKVVAQMWAKCLADAPAHADMTVMADQIDKRING